MAEPSQIGNNEPQKGSFWRMSWTRENGPPSGLAGHFQ